MTGTKARRVKAEEFERARGAALAHPWRHDMLMILRERPATVTELSEELKVKRDLLAYHVRYLAGKIRQNRFQFIELIATDRRRGGTQFIWKAIEEPHVDKKTASELPRHVRERQSVRVVAEMIEDLEEATRAGTMDDEELRNLVRFHEDLDEQGWSEFADLMDEVIERRKSIVAGVQNRKASENVKTTPAAFHLSQFPIPARYRGGTPA